MSMAVDHFDVTGEWASVGLLQNAMVEHHDRSDAEREADRLPGKFGRRGEGDRVTLTVAGIYRAEPNHQIVDDFERSLGFAFRQYRRRRDPRVEATISTRDLVEKLSFTELQAQRAIVLLREELLISPQQPAGESFSITPEMHHFRSVRDAEGYVKVKAKRDRQRCVAKKRGAISKATIGDRRGIRAVLLATLATVLAAFILWVGHQIWPTDGDASEHHRKSGSAHSYGSSGGARWLDAEERGATPESRVGQRPLALAGTH
jgi:hypothetical protein